MGSHLPIGIYAIPEISIMGASEDELTRGEVPYETGMARYREIARGQIPTSFAAETNAPRFSSTLTVLAIDLEGDWLRDQLDPRLDT